MSADESEGEVDCAPRRLARMASALASGAPPRLRPEPVRPLLTVVIPTLNERDAIGPLLDELDRALGAIEWRAVVVDDDSPDGTADHVKARAQGDPRIVCLRRVGRRGLTGAVVEGALAASTPYVAVIDGDGQHDPAVLVELLARMQREDADLGVASRFVEGGSAAHGMSRRRLRLSRFAARLGRPAAAHALTDPMSGCFVIRRTCLEAAAPRLTSGGFKVLLDLLAMQPRPLRVVEAPMSLRARESGRSKFELRIAADHAALLGAHALRGLLTARALLFAGVGTSGLLVHMLVLGFLAPHGFAGAEVAATAAALTSNFLANNALTYRDRRLRGWGLLTGYAKFAGCCSAGALGSVCTALFVQEHLHLWWAAGLAGAGVGAAWNYLSTALLVW